MLSLFKSALVGLANTGRSTGLQGVLQSHLKVLSAGMKTYEVPPDYSEVVLPERPKLKFLNKVPNFKKARKEMKKLRDIQGPAQTANTFTKGQYGIVALGGGYLHFGHMEMMRLTINRRMDPRTTFARWRINAPYKPITRKGLGQRMGGGKGNIDHYVTPVKYGRMIVEVGGRLELGEVEPILKEVAKKLPFPAKCPERAWQPCSRSSRTWSRTTRTPGPSRGSPGATCWGSGGSSAPLTSTTTGSTAESSTTRAGCEGVSVVPPNTF
ncbi:large ribosomal subunit protein uL16m-like isoform X1 [Oncorhynchus masou masou]|uniref:large ribosomal subunit protein uL16m-like isoform X1 n=2 Tax=Salmoninae TaxID=504568 RepID=UPI003183592B